MQARAFVLDNEGDEQSNVKLEEVSELELSPAGRSRVLKTVFADMSEPWFRQNEDRRSREVGS